MTLAELQADLTKVNNAITKLLNNEFVKELQIGSGSTIRRYQYADISLDSLKALREELMQKIAAYSTEIPKFRTNQTIPLKVVKGIH